MAQEVTLNSQGETAKLSGQIDPSKKYRFVVEGGDIRYASKENIAHNGIFYPDGHYSVETNFDQGDLWVYADSLNASEITVRIDLADSGPESIFAYIRNINFGSLPDFNLQSVGGTQQSGVDIANVLDQLEDALTSVGTDSLRTNLQQVGGTGQSGVDIANVLDQLEDALASVGTDELRVTQISQTAIADDPITDSTASSGSANAATLDLGDVRTIMDAHTDLSAVNGDLVFEVSPDNVNWREHTRIASADLSTGQRFDQLDTAYRYIRAYYTGNDADLTLLEVSAKGR